MNRVLSNRDRQTLLLGVGIIGVLLLISRGVPALRTWEEAQLALAATSQEELIRVRVGRRGIGELRDSLRTRKLRLAAIDSTMVSGPSASAVTAALADRIGEIAHEQSVQVTALQLRTDTLVVGGFVRPEARVVGTTDITGLAGFLRAIEGGECPLVVKDLSVSQSEPSAPDQKVETLRVDVVIAALGLVTGKASK